MWQLSPLDASFLYAESSETPMHIAGLLTFEKPEGYSGDFYEDYKKRILKRQAEWPFANAIPYWPPLSLDHPFWIEEGAFDIDYHLVRMELPAPGTKEQLEDLAGMLHGIVLERNKPLWRYYVIEGVDGGRKVALYMKTHHACIDGGQSAESADLYFDLTPEGSDKSVIQTEEIKKKLSKPTPLEVVSCSYENIWKQDWKTWQFGPKIISALDRARKDLVRLHPTLKDTPLTAPKTRFNVNISGERIISSTQLPFKTIHGLSKRTGTKINDIILTICGHALRKYLEENDNLPSTSLISGVPYSLREKGDTEFKNKATMIFCSLATLESEPLARLRSIAASSTIAKTMISDFKGLVDMEASHIGAPLFMKSMYEMVGKAKLADQLPALMNLTISNFPGPPVPLYLAGLRCVENVPLSIPVHGSAVNITTSTYQGMFSLSLVACRQTVPDLHKITRYIEEGLEALEKEVQGMEVDSAVPSPDASESVVTAEQSRIFDGKVIDSGPVDGKPAQAKEPDLSKPVSKKVASPAKRKSQPKKTGDTTDAQAVENKKTASVKKVVRKKKAATKKAATKKAATKKASIKKASTKKASTKKAAIKKVPKVSPEPGGSGID